MAHKIKELIETLKQNPNEYISKAHTIRLAEVLCMEEEKTATEDKKAHVEEDETAESVLLRRGVHYTIPNEIKTVTVKSALQAMKEFGAQERNMAIQECIERLENVTINSTANLGGGLIKALEELSKLKK